LYWNKSQILQTLLSFIYFPHKMIISLLLSHFLLCKLKYHSKTYPD
jgi:hypothetical protein